jgi:hypothetical protein
MKRKKGREEEKEQEREGRKYDYELSRTYFVASDHFLASLAYVINFSLLTT